jgi:ComF family protein
LNGFARFNALINHGIRLIQKAVFPSKCLACGALYHDKTDSAKGFAKDPVLHRGDFSSSQTAFIRAMEPYLCPDCSTGFDPLQSPMCPQCGVMFETRHGEDHLCGDCIGSPRHFSKARSLGVYDNTLMSVIHRLKYNGKIQLADPLGALLFSLFLMHWGKGGIDLVVPVPLHVKRFRKRGFNQSLLLVGHWDRWAGSLDQGKWRLEIGCRLLVRTRQTQPQTGLNRKNRLENIKNAFAVVKPEDVRDKRILLVDDVFTTGTTVDECAKALQRAGARQVDVLTVARAL